MKILKTSKSKIFAALITLGIGVPSFASTGVLHSPNLNNNNKTVNLNAINTKGVNNQVQKTPTKFANPNKTEGVIENIELDTLPYIKNLQAKINVYTKAIKKGEISTEQARKMLYNDPYYQHVEKNLKLLIEIKHYLNEKINQIINYDMEHKKDFKITEQELKKIKHVKNNIIKFFNRNGKLLQNLVNVVNEQLMREGTKYAVKNNIDEYKYVDYYNKNDIKGLGL